MIADSTECFYHCSNRFAGRLFCICGGFVDTVGYFLLKYIFTASITGNLIKIVTAERSIVVCLLSVSAFYGIGSAIVRILSIYMRSYKQVDNLVVAIVALTLEVLTLLFTILLGVNLENDIVNSDVSSTSVVLVACLLALAMGVQVGTAAVAIAGFPNTTGMTASVASSFSAVANLFLAYLQKTGFITFFLSFNDNYRIKESSDNRQVREAEIMSTKIDSAWDELDKQVWPLIYFVGGASLGAYMSHIYSFSCLFLPSGIVCLFIVEIALKKWWKIKKEDDVVVTYGAIEKGVKPTFKVVTFSHSYYVLKSPSDEIPTSAVR